VLQATVQVAAQNLQASVAAAETAYVAAVTAIETALVAAVEVFYDNLQTQVDTIITAAEQDVDAMITAAEVVLAAFVERQQQAIVAAEVQLDKAVDQAIAGVKVAIDAVSDAVAWVIDQVPNKVIEGFIDFWNSPWRDMVVIGLATIAAVAITVATVGTGAPVAAILLAAVIGGVMAGSAYGAGELASRQGEVDLNQDRPGEIYVPNHGYLKPVFYDPAHGTLKPGEIGIDPMTGQMQLPDGVDPAMFDWAMSNFNYDPATGTLDRKSNGELFAYAGSEALEGFVVRLPLGRAGGRRRRAGRCRGRQGRRHGGQPRGRARREPRGRHRHLPRHPRHGRRHRGGLGRRPLGRPHVGDHQRDRGARVGASMKDAVKGGLQTLKYGLTDPPRSAPRSSWASPRRPGQVIDPHFANGIETGVMRDPALKRMATDMLVETVSEQAGSGLGLAAVTFVGALAAGKSPEEAARLAVDKGGDYYTLTNIAMSVAMNVAGGNVGGGRPPRRLRRHQPSPSCSLRRRRRPGPDGPHHWINADGTAATRTRAGTRTRIRPRTGLARHRRWRHHGGVAADGRRRTSPRAAAHGNHRGGLPAERLLDPRPLGRGSRLWRRVRGEVERALRRLGQGRALGGRPDRGAVRLRGPGLPRIRRRARRSRRPGGRCRDGEGGRRHPEGGAEGRGPVPITQAHRDSMADLFDKLRRRA
jgi:hypothetical protein